MSEALQLMRVGSKWKIYVSRDWAYGDEGGGNGITPGATLAFDLELLGIKRANEEQPRLRCS